MNVLVQIGVSYGGAGSTVSPSRRQLAQSWKFHHTGSGEPLLVWNWIATSSRCMVLEGTDDSNETQSDS